MLVVLLVGHMYLTFHDTHKFFNLCVNCKVGIGKGAFPLMSGGTEFCLA